MDERNLARSMARGCRMVVRRLLVPTLLLIAATGMQASAASEDLVPSGKVEIDQVQLAFIVSGNIGDGTLHYAGKSYKFSVGGLGVGGFGLSNIEATGQVYNLKNLKDFAGAYGQARIGIVAGQKSTGSLWLENPKGVYISLDAKREGLALSLGADAVYIKLK